MILADHTLRRAALSQFRRVVSTRSGPPVSTTIASARDVDGSS
jgi:hypothetical protein